MVKEWMLSPQQSGQGHLLSPLLFNIVLEVLASVIWQEKDTEGRQIRKKQEIKLPLFADDIIVCIENPKKSLKILQSELSKTAV